MHKHKLRERVVMFALDKNLTELTETTRNERSQGTQRHKTHTHTHKKRNDWGEEETGENYLNDYRITDLKGLCCNRIHSRKSSSYNEYISKIGN